MKIGLLNFNFAVYPAHTNGKLNFRLTDIIILLYSINNFYQNNITGLTLVIEASWTTADEILFRTKLIGKLCQINHKKSNTNTLQT